jgi:hypothetical protein
MGSLISIHNEKIGQQILFLIYQMVLHSNC